jgi:hypothetical protein
MADDLRRFLANQPIHARRPPRTGPALRFARRHWRLLTTAAAVLAALGGLIFASRVVRKSRESVDQSFQNEAEVLGQMYGVEMHGVFGTWQEDRPDDVTKLLQRYVPRQESLEVRDFEWGWLKGLTRAQPVLLPGHTGPVLYVDISPRGDLAASVGTDGKLRLWELKSSRAIITRAAHRGTARWVAFSPRGERIVTAGDDGIVRIWGDRDWRQVAEHYFAPKPTCAAFTADGAAVVAGDSQGQLHRWTPADDAITSIEPTADRFAAWPSAQR